MFLLLLVSGPPRPLQAGGGGPGAPQRSLEARVSPARRNRGLERRPAGLALPGTGGTGKWGTQLPRPRLSGALESSLPALGRLVSDAASGQPMDNVLNLVFTTWPVVRTQPIQLSVVEWTECGRWVNAVNQVSGAYECSPCAKTSLLSTAHCITFTQQFRGSQKKTSLKREAFHRRRRRLFGSGLALRNLLSNIKI